MSDRSNKLVMYEGNNKKIKAIYYEGLWYYPRKQNKTLANRTAKNKPIETIIQIDTNLFNYIEQNEWDKKIKDYTAKFGEIK